MDNNDVDRIHFMERLSRIEAMIDDTHLIVSNLRDKQAKIEGKLSVIAGAVATVVSLISGIAQAYFGK
jgi:hypothetical protein